MADAIFITHFVLLLTFKLCPGERPKSPLLEEHQNGLDSEEPAEPPESLNPRFSANSGAPRRFKCYSCEGMECSNPEFCDNAITCWKSRVRESNGIERVKRACTTEPDQVPLICNKVAPGSKHGALYHVECCQADLCNDGPFPMLERLNACKFPRNYQSPDWKRLVQQWNVARSFFNAGSGNQLVIREHNDGEDYAVKLTLAILGPMVGLGAVAGGVLFCLLARRTRRKRPLAPRRNKLLMDSELEPSMLHFPPPSPTSTQTYHPHELRATAAGDSTLKEYLDGRSLTSGSGSGLPLLVQRTLAKQVALVECLDSGGSGFGGEIWRGVWHGESVAVKIYFSRDEAAWARETEVYSQLLPSRHDNILGYVGSDMTSRASCTQLWLVTHYHPLGSLHDHLSCSPHSLTHHQTLNICLGIANGLLYLHTEINGTKGKPAMAHRNLRSKNILVKTNGSCVIADFALAATQDRLTTDRIDLRQGSKRYMSPEVLEQTLNTECLESFRCADIYSLGLILWEVCRRCISNGVALDYTTPYSEWLTSSTQEPSIEEMRKLVSLDQRRPPIPNRWHSDATLAGMGKLMRECWHGKPAARLPILRVKKTLIKLAANDPRVHLHLD